MRPQASSIRDTPEFRAAFCRAVGRYMYERMLLGPDFYSAFERGFERFTAGEATTFDVRLELILNANDTVFMPLLFEEARRLTDLTA